jgi:hypothetical protein
LPLRVERYCVTTWSHEPSSLIFSVFLDQHGLPRHVLTRDYLVTVVTALANRMVEDADFLTYVSCVRLFVSARHRAG